MDAKITKVRLSRMLSYDWLKIIGTAVALIFVWVLVFTMTATRVLPSQQFIVCNYVGNNTLTRAYNMHLNDSLQDEKFSHELIEASIQDLALDRQTAYQILPARISTKEFDLMFVSAQPDEGTATQTTDSSGETTVEYGSTYLESFVRSYSYSLHDVNAYLPNMKAFLQKYYGEDYATGELNAQKVEEDFRARIKKAKDKRYKKEGEIQKGVQGEIERMDKLRSAYIYFMDCLETGVVKLSQVTNIDEATGVDYFKNKIFAINICPDENGEMKQLSKYVSYPVTVKGEDGKETITSRAENMNVCLFDLNGEGAYAYEGMLYLTHLIQSVRNLN